MKNIIKIVIIVITAFLLISCSPPKKMLLIYLGEDQNKSTFLRKVRAQIDHDTIEIYEPFKDDISYNDKNFFLSINYNDAALLAWPHVRKRDVSRLNSLMYDLINSSIDIRMPNFAQLIAQAPQAWFSPYSALINILRENISIGHLKPSLRSLRKQIIESMKNIDGTEQKKALLLQFREKILMHLEKDMSQKLGIIIEKRLKVLGVTKDNLVIVGEHLGSDVGVSLFESYSDNKVIFFIKDTLLKNSMDKGPHFFICSYLDREKCVKHFVGNENVIY